MTQSEKNKAVPWRLDVSLGGKKQYAQCLVSKLLVTVVGWGVIEFWRCWKVAKGQKLENSEGL